MAHRTCGMKIKVQRIYYYPPFRWWAHDERSGAYFMTWREAINFAILKAKRHD